MPLKKLHSLLLFLITSNCLQAQLDSNDFSRGTERSGYKIIYGYNQFRNKLDFGVQDSVVTFFLRNNEHAKKIFLSGSFCNWLRDAISMTKTDSGWIARVKLGTGQHTYKFIIDGVWAIDNDNLTIEKTDEGYLNSVYFKTNTVIKLDGYLNARKVRLFGSFNRWKPDEIQLLKTRVGWQLPVFLADGTYTYAFLIDDKRYHDPGNYAWALSQSAEVVSIINIGRSNPSNELNYYTTELARSQSTRNKKEISISAANMGNAYMRSGDFESARKMFENALLLFDELQDQDSKLRMLTTISDACRMLADMPCQLNYLQRALTGYQKIGHIKGLAFVNFRLGSYYMNLGEWTKQAEYFEKALELYKQLGSEKDEAIAMGYLAHAYGLIPNHAKQLAYLQKSMAINKRVNKSALAGNFWILSGYEMTVLHDTVKAHESLQNAYELSKELDIKNLAPDVLVGFADLYLPSSDSVLKKIGLKPEEKYVKAIEMQKKSLQLYTELNSLPRQEVLFRVISETYEKIAAFDSSLLYYKRYIKLNGSMLGIEKQKAMVRLETKYEYEKKEDSLNFQQEVMNQKLEKQGLLFKQQQQQLELNNSQLALINKEKDLQKLVYLKTQADLTISQREKQLQQINVKTLTQEKHLDKLNRQRQWVYVVNGFVLLSLGGLYFLYRARLRESRLKAVMATERMEQQQKEARFQRQLGDTSLSALRSQMNPHFIFNCLNSIKLYTTQNDTVAATEYLTKFSKLIRLVLENSRNNRITLTSELDALRLYMEMEVMRFKEKLEYNLSVDKDVDMDYIEIPPLLLQPYVENAIWHGLMQKEEGGQIDITVGMQDSESILVINITDNGIGRAKAAELESKTATKHKSYGMKVTSERLALINQVYKTGAEVTINDLTDTDGRALGTRVTVKIPID